MTDPHLFTAVSALVYALCAAIDGLWLHLWRYRLHLHAPAEHAVHTLRAVLFPAVVLLFFMGWTSGILLWCGAILALVDLLLVARDAAMEMYSRKFQRGLPAGEAALHTLLQALHVVVLACAVAARPWSSWTTTATTEAGPDTLAQVLLLVVLSGSVVVAIVHVALWARRPSSAPASRSARLRQVPAAMPVPVAATTKRLPARLRIWRRHLTLHRRSRGSL